MAIAFFFLILLHNISVGISEELEGLQLNGTHSLLLCVDCVNLLGERISSIKKTTEIIRYQ
jgi:hypothetical protein